MRRGLIVLVIAYSSLSLSAQVISSGNFGCTVGPAGGMGMRCNGITSPNSRGKEPQLFVTHVVVETGAALNFPNSSSDYLIIGIRGGNLMNEKPPFRPVSLEKDVVTLMPRGQPFRLRNKAKDKVEFQLIEIRRRIN
jgi:hypothetical protein